MRRLFRWIAGLVSVAALAKLLSGRRHRRDASPDGAASSVEPDPAEELRRKLAEVRASAPTDESPPAAGDAAEASATSQAGTATDDVPAGDEPSQSIEERRAAIHARAQEAIEAMKEIDP